MLKVSKVLLLAFALIYMSFFVVFAGEQEKEILKALEKVSSFSERSGSPEFHKALSDCQAEIKIAKMTESDYPKFMKAAEEVFLLFKSEKELQDEVDDIGARKRSALVQADITSASRSEKLDIQLDYAQRGLAIMYKILDKQKAAQQRLEALYRVYKEEVLKKGSSPN